MSDIPDPRKASDGYIASLRDSKWVWEGHPSPAASDDLFTDEDRAAVLSVFHASGGFILPSKADEILRAVAPSIAARAVANLMDELMNMDAAGAFGECCANPDCRACTVLQHIAVRADQIEGTSDDQDEDDDWKGDGYDDLRGGYFG